MKLGIPYGLIVIGLVLIVGCEHADPLSGDGDPDATLSDIQATIFNPSCAVSGCHAGSNPRQGLNLSAGQAYANLVGVPSNERPALNRVEPGDPDNSYLVHKIEGRAGIGGQQMPLGRAPLSADQMATIREWIANGAENN